MSHFCSNERKNSGIKFHERIQTSSTSHFLDSSVYLNEPAKNSYKREFYKKKKTNSIIRKIGVGFVSMEIFVPS